MTTKATKAGKGSEAMARATMPGGAAARATAPRAARPPKGKDPTTQSIPLNKLVAWDGNPRRVMTPEDVERIAESIAAKGQLTNLKARPIGPDSYQVYIGNTRLQAFMSLVRQGRCDQFGDAFTDTYPVAVEVQNVDDKAAYEAALIENIAKNSMHKVEEAEGVLRLAEDRMQEREIGRRIGMTVEEVHAALKVARLDERAKGILRADRRPYRWGLVLADCPAALRNRILAEVEESNDAWATADMIRAAIRINRINADNARFDLDAAGIAVTTDLVDGSRWIVDVDAFREHQAKWVEAKTAELERDGQTVLILRDRTLETYRYRRDPDAPVRRAFVEWSRDGVVKVHDNMVSIEDDAAAASAADALDGLLVAPVAATTEAPLDEPREVAAPSITHARPSKGKALVALGDARVAAGMAAMRADQVLALRVLAAAIMNRRELTYQDHGQTDDLVVARDGVRASLGLPSDRMVRPEELPDTVEGLASLLQEVAATTLSGVPNRRSPFPEGGETLVGRAMMEPGAMRRHWTPGRELFEAMTLEEARTLAAELMEGEDVHPGAMSAKQLVDLLADAFRSVRAGDHDLLPATVERIRRWVPTYVGTPDGADEAAADGDEGIGGLFE